jgi:hypothetical protein
MFGKVRPTAHARGQDERQREGRDEGTSACHGGCSAAHSRRGLRVRVTHRDCPLLHLPRSQTGWALRRGRRRRIPRPGPGSVSSEALERASHQCQGLYWAPGIERPVRRYATVCVSVCVCVCGVCARANAEAPVYMHTCRIRDALARMIDMVVEAYLHMRTRARTHKQTYTQTHT